MERLILFHFSNDFFTGIINYIFHQEEYDDYNKARKLLHDIFENKTKIWLVADKINDKSICRKIIREAYKYTIKYSDINDESKIKKYKNILSINNVDLFLYLNNDSTTKYTNEYLYCFNEDSDNEMTVEDYLFYHSFPENEKDMSDEQYIIKNTIDDIFYDLENYLKEFYFEVFLYCFFQTDPEYTELRCRITDILIFESKIDDIIKRYFNNRSSIPSFKDASKINNKCFNQRLKFFKDDINDDIKKKYKRYKKSIDDKINNNLDGETIFVLLREDAYTDDAKKYFGIE